MILDVCACVCVFPRRRQFKRWTGDGTDGRIAPRLRKQKNARAAFPLRQPASSFSVFFTSSRSSFSLSSNSGFLSLSWECTSLPPKIRLSDAYPSLVVSCLRCDGSRQTSLSFFDCSLGGFGVGFIDGGRKIRSGALRFIPRLRHPLTIPIFFERLALRASVSLSFSVFDSLLSGSKLQASSLVAVRWRGDIMERKSIN